MNSSLFHHQQSGAHKRSKRLQSPQPQTQEPPAFFDATATVSSTQFGACRLPELKALLWKTSVVAGTTKACSKAQLLGTVQTRAFASGGRKTSNRHLRRRATSHKPWKRVRRLITPGPPSETASAAAAEANPSKSRKVRRQHVHSLQKQHESWRWSRLEEATTTSSTRQPFTLNNDNKNAAQITTTHWMTTHVWHAKRFRMQILWTSHSCWSVPILHSGRGCDAAVRLAREGKCLIQDVTWRLQPIVLQGIVKAEEEAQLEQTIGQLIPDFALTNVDGSGEGLLHENDSFPNSAIGPVTWICTRGRPLLSSLSESSNRYSAEYTVNQLWIYLFVHPSIRSTALSLFRAMLFANNGKIECPAVLDGINGGLVCFQLRGLSAASCLKKILMVSTSDFHAEPTLHEFLNNVGDATPTALNQHGSLLWSSSMQRCSLPFCLRRVRLRDTTAAKANNYFACGFDLFLCPMGSSVRDQEQALTNTIFHNLVLAGACPIGLTEEAALQLECDPSIPVFPRDYPDTEQGKLYWSSSDDDWLYVRKHWDGGGGRIRIKCEELVPDSVDWSELVAKGESSSESSVAVVRGAFADPFRATLAGVGNLPGPSTVGKASDQGNASARRRRRPSDTPFCAAAPPRSTAEFVVHEEICQSLLSALTLPAVLLCHVQVLGKGILKPRGRLYRWATETGTVDADKAPLLGIVTAAAFSVARGCSHGMAVVGATAFLQAVAVPQSEGAYVMVRRLHGKGGQLQLKVCVRPQNQDSSQIEATLSLL